MPVGERAGTGGRARFPYLPRAAAPTFRVAMSDLHGFVEAA